MNYLRLKRVSLPSASPPMLKGAALTYAPVGGFTDWLSDVAQANKEFFLMVVSDDPYAHKSVAEMQAEKDKLEKAAADKIALRAAANLAAERKVKEEAARRGAIVAPPPLTAAQRNIEQLKEEYKLIRRKKQQQSLLVLAGLGVGGFVLLKMLNKGAP